MPPGGQSARLALGLAAVHGRPPHAVARRFRLLYRSPRWHRTGSRQGRGTKTSGARSPSREVRPPQVPARRVWRVRPAIGRRQSDPGVDPRRQSVTGPDQRERRASVAETQLDPPEPLLELGVHPWLEAEPLEQRLRADLVGHRDCNGDHRRERCRSHARKTNGTRRTHRPRRQPDPRYSDATQHRSPPSVESTNTSMPFWAGRGRFDAVVLRWHSVPASTAPSTFEPACTTLAERRRVLEGTVARIVVAPLSHGIVSRYRRAGIEVDESRPVLRGVPIDRRDDVLRARIRSSRGRRSCPGRSR